MDPVALFLLVVLSLGALWGVVYSSVLAAIRKAQQPVAAPLRVETTSSA